jgi:hypothetical protein
VIASLETCGPQAAHGQAGGLTVDLEKNPAYLETVSANQLFEERKCWVVTVGS